LNEFRRHDVWPPKNLTPMTWHLDAGGRLSTTAPKDGNGFVEYVSDPERPVPFIGYVGAAMTSDYMTEDQRFASRRTDVVTWRTDKLDNDVVIAGPIKVNLRASSSGTDSDFVVKVIDVYPDDYPTPPPPQGQPVPANAVRMGGYQQLVRGEPFRAKFRHGFDKPEPLKPNEPTAIEFEVPDAYHAFRRGHRIMVQVQSSWFPLVDRNPQKFMEIPRATGADFQKATQRIYRSSSVQFMVEGR
jgi:putative CocE/NonD family hydrolase